MLEKQVENKIKKWLEQNNHWYFKVHGGAFQKTGVPDIIACINGKIVSELQKAQIQKIKDSGGLVGVAHNMEEFWQILKDGGLL